MIMDYKEQLHIDSVSQTDSGKYFVDFILPDKGISYKTTFQINKSDFEKCKTAMFMQDKYPMKIVSEAMGALKSAKKIGFQPLGPAKQSGAIGLQSVAI